MAFTVTKSKINNSIVITNTDLLLPIQYTIEYYTASSSTSFTPVSGFFVTPTTTLAAGANITTDLITDNVYKLTVAGGVNSPYYFIVDFNIRTCRRNYILAILCEDDTPCSDALKISRINDYLRFKVLENNVYYIWNKWVQTQSVTDLIVPSDNELLSEADWIAKLNKFCSSCSTTTNCVGPVSYISKSDCGCS